jgi:hypothetical protein
MTDLIVEKAYEKKKIWPPGTLVRAAFAKKKND